MAFIVLEGLSGVGKSTLAPLVAEQLDAEFLPSIPHEFAAARRMVDQQKDVEVRHLFFLAALGVTSLALSSRLVEDSRHLVLESYIARAQAFHKGMGSGLEVNMGHFLQPKLTFYLDCEEHVRRQRIEQRGGKATNYWQRRAEESAMSIREEYEKMDLIHVRAMGATPEALASHICEVVRRDLWTSSC